MLCQKCGRNEATVHRETTSFGQKVEEHLCALCAGTDISGMYATRVDHIEVHLRGIRNLPVKVLLPKDEELIPNGLSVLHSFASRLLSPNKLRVTLLVATMDGHGGILLWHEKGETVFSGAIDQIQYPKLESPMRLVLKSYNLIPSSDFQYKYNGCPDRMRVIECKLSESVDFVAAFTRDMLVKCFNVGDADMLRFTLLSDDEFLGQIIDKSKL